MLKPLRYYGNYSYKTSYIALDFLNYMSSMLSIHLKHMQSLSLIDICLHIEERHWGFRIGKMNDFYKKSPLFS